MRVADVARVGWYERDVDVVPEAGEGHIGSAGIPPVGPPTLPSRGWTSIRNTEDTGSY